MENGVGQVSEGVLRKGKRGSTTNDREGMRGERDPMTVTPNPGFFPAPTGTAEKGAQTNGLVRKSKGTGRKGGGNGKQYR